MIKFLIIAVVLIALSLIINADLSKEQIKEIQHNTLAQKQPIFNKCQQLSGATDDDLQLFYADDFSHFDAPLESYVCCVMYELHKANSDGSPNENGIYDFYINQFRYKPCTVKRAFGLCKNTEGTSECNRAANVHKCLAKNGLPSLLK